LVDGAALCRAESAAGESGEAGRALAVVQSGHGWSESAAGILASRTGAAAQRLAVSRARAVDRGGVDAGAAQRRARHSVRRGRLGATGGAAVRAGGEPAPARPAAEGGRKVECPLFFFAVSPYWYIRGVTSRCRIRRWRAERAPGVSPGFAPWGRK